MPRPLFLAAVLLWMLLSGPAHAQSALAVQNAKDVAKVCPARWTEQTCLSSVSKVTLTMAANYAGSLQESGKTAESESIKQDCAAATAASEGAYPAYAIQSAFTECANTIADISEKTGMNPDLSQYQILGGAVLCLQKNPACVFIEMGLKTYEK